MSVQYQKNDRFKHCSNAIIKIIVFVINFFILIVHCQETETVDVTQCYDSPGDLFQVYPQLNGTFKIKIKKKCLQLQSLELFLYALDLSIVDQVFLKEIDQLDQSKLNSIKINRPVMLFGPTELTNFPTNSRFKLAIVFMDHTGVVNIALHPKEFHFYNSMAEESSTTELFLIMVLGALLVVTVILLAMLIYIQLLINVLRNYFNNGRVQNNLILWRKNRGSRKLMKGKFSTKFILNDLIGYEMKLAHLLNDQDNEGEIILKPKSHVIHVDKILTMINELLNEESLKAEYTSVPKSKLNSWNYGRLPEHRIKNRYGNLLPYDHTRVILEKTSPEETNYINANFIDGYHQPNKYIAMQGPIETTIEDFWRCVWQHRCQQIVMLTNLEESGKIKCEKYWPDNSQMYGKIKITLHNSELFADYIIRTFMLEKNNEQLLVIQYHFLSWPDHNIPMYACTFISFINRIRSSALYAETNHIVVHCSAGIGRTGAFILIDSMLEMAKKEKKIDVLGHFCKIRPQRINMVETFAQYSFVYQVLVEALSHESTDISCSDFESYFMDLTKGNDKNCKLIEQFEILNVMSFRKLSPEICKFGLLNFKLNRRSDVIPPDYARVILPHHEDYMNAVYVNGYRKQDAYIVTQIPFENNRQQFWKMIENTKSTMILLLGDVNTEDLIYWPQLINKKFDFNNELIVTLVKEEILTNNMTLRTFHLKPSDLVVRQFHVQGINAFFSTGNHHQTQQPSLWIDIREKLENLSPTSHPLVVQCIDGVQLSGVFCAGNFIFERIKEEQQIDVFLAVQKIRSNRPQFIINFEQYHYLHQMALAYVQSFDQYANFK